MNQAQQMNESLGEAKGLGKFVRKLEEIENDINTAKSGFAAVGKQIMRSGKASGGGGTQALIDKAIKLMADAEAIVLQFRVSVTE